MLYSSSPAKFKQLFFFAEKKIELLLNNGVYKHLIISRSLNSSANSEGEIIFVVFPEFIFKNIITKFH